MNRYLLADDEYMSTLVEKMEQIVAPKQNTFDAGHRIEHLRSVYHNATEMAFELELAVDPVLLMVACYMHDYCLEDRTNHHTNGGKYFRENGEEIFNTLGVDWYPIDIELVACAIEEHRASYKGAYTSLLSKVLSAADRGSPGYIGHYFVRTFQYGLEKHPEKTLDEHIYRAWEHINEKYGTDGYARFNEIYKEFYKRDHKEMVRIADLPFNYERIVSYIPSELLALVK